MYSGGWPKWRKSDFAPPSKTVKMVFLGVGSEPAGVVSAPPNVLGRARKEKVFGRGRLRWCIGATVVRFVFCFLRAEVPPAAERGAPHVQGSVAKMEKIWFCPPSKTAKMIFLGVGSEPAGVVSAPPNVLGRA